MKGFLNVLILISGILLEMPLLADDVPIAPIAIEKTEQGDEVYALRSTFLNLLVSPKQGGIVSLKTRGLENIADRGFQFEVIHAEPLPAWESRAWRTSEGRQVVMLSKKIEHPLPLRIVHFIELSTDGKRVMHSTRITALSPGDTDQLQPLLRFSLKKPDAYEENIDQILLQFGEVSLGFKSSWAIEDPERKIGALTESSRSEDSLLLKSSPKEPLTLPPQGWTLIAKFEFHLSDFAQKNTEKAIE